MMKRPRPRIPHGSGTVRSLHSMRRPTAAHPAIPTSRPTTPCRRAPTERSTVAHTQRRSHHVRKMRPLQLPQRVRAGRRREPRAPTAWGSHRTIAKVASSRTSPSWNLTTSRITRRRASGARTPCAGSSGDHAVPPEELTGRRAGLHDAVGQEQHGVAGCQRHRRSFVAARPQPERKAGPHRIAAASPSCARTTAGDAPRSRRRPRRSQCRS